MTRPSAKAVRAQVSSITDNSTKPSTVEPDAVFVGWYQNPECTGEQYIRAAVNITWMKDADASDQTVTARTPQNGTDYDITYLVNTGWIEGTDGYWYYQSPVVPGANTGTLIENCTQLATANVPEGYHLSVEIVASAIQSSPETVVLAEWKVALEDGKIVSANGSGVSGE